MGKNSKPYAGNSDYLLRFIGDDKFVKSRPDETGSVYTTYDVAEALRLTEKEALKIGAFFNVNAITIQSFPEWKQWVVSTKDNNDTFYSIDEFGDIEVGKCITKFDTIQFAEEFIRTHKLNGVPERLMNVYLRTGYEFNYWKRASSYDDGGRGLSRNEY